MSRTVRLTVHAAVATVLTSVALHPLFVSGTWFWATTFAVVVVSVSSLLGRRFSLPAAVCALLGLAALLWYLTLLFASSEATFHVLPDRSSMVRLVELSQIGFKDIGQYTAPVPSLTGIDLLTVAGIGLVAVLVDLLAVGMRQAALAGLPLFAVFIVPVAIQLDSIGGLSFVVAATGFISLLLADGRERLTRWGRPVLRRRPSDTRAANRSPNLPDAAPLSVAGRRIGLVAVLIALVFPLFIPDLPARAFGTGGLGGVGGTNTIAAPSPMVSLKRDLNLPQEIEVLRYRTRDQAPGYLRIYALDRFDGQEWKISRVRAGPDDRVEGQRLSVPGLGDVATKPVATEISIDPDVQDLKFLPVPYPPSRVDINGDWRVDRNTLMIFSTSDVAGGRTYQVQSLEVNASRERLRGAPQPPDEIRERYLPVPENLPKEVRELAERVTKDATTSYGKALALQEWFTSGEFTYSLATRGNSTSALTDFLLRSKTGYCEQFAGSMALLARVVGVPARVAVGYTAGTPQGGEWAITTHDAHAWPELYFDGVGWLRFEPTPAGAVGQATATVPPYAQEPVAGGPSANTDAQGGQADASGDNTPGQQPTSDPNSRIDGRTPNLGGGGATPDDPRGPWMLAALAAGMVSAVLLVTPVVGRQFVRRRRWATARTNGARARAAWAEFRDDSIDLGVPWRSSDSPRTAARRVAEHLGLDGEPARALARIASAEERARYAPTVPDTRGISRDSRLLRRAMASAAGAGARWKAALFPASTIAAFRGLGQELGRVFDWAELMGSAARARLLGGRT